MHGRAFSTVLAWLLLVAPAGAELPATWPQPRPINDASARSAGLRKLAAERLTLYTDLPAEAEVDALAGLFDQAYPQWCAFFGLPEKTAEPWRMNGFLIVDRARFARAGALPAGLPEFRNGFAWDADLWLNEQPTPYYRRHLLLHEGTHGFMYMRLGSCGPTWLMEGVAELLATHALVEGRLQLHHFPRSRAETLHLGRIKLVRAAVAAGRRRTVDEVLAVEASAHLENETYAWCWALCAMLDGAPRYHERFRATAIDVGNPESATEQFNRRFRARFAADWRELNDDWAVFTGALEYGHDLTRSAIDFKPGAVMPAGGAKVSVAVDRGWQSSGLRLEGGKSYSVAATGRYEIAQSPRPWQCDPGGVSIRYYGGRPLGQLLAVVRPDDAPAGSANPFLAAESIGLAATLRPTTPGTLYLKINDTPAELADNRGAVIVTITPGE